MIPLSKVYFVRDTKMPGQENRSMLGDADPQYRPFFDEAKNVVLVARIGKDWDAEGQPLKVGDVVTVPMAGVMNMWMSGDVLERQRTAIAALLNPQLSQRPAK